MMPRRRKWHQSAPKGETRRFDFHFFVDTTTLLASIATVIALFYLIHDRRDQANIAAWNLLQGYMQHEPRERFNEGQGFALETLSRQGVSLDELDAHGVLISDADLHGMEGKGASFQHSILAGIDFSGALFFAGSFEGAAISSCNCRYTRFTDANLRGATLGAGDYRDASFLGADVSDLTAGGEIQLDRDAFAGSCYRPGHPPRLDFSRVDGPPRSSRPRLSMQG